MKPNARNGRGGRDTRARAAAGSYNARGGSAGRRDITGNNARGGSANRREPAAETRRTGYLQTPVSRYPGASGSSREDRADVYARYSAGRPLPDGTRRTARKRPPPGRFDFLKDFFRPLAVFRRRIKRRIKETGGARLYLFIRLLFTCIILAALSFAVYAIATRKNAGEVFVGDIRVGIVRMRSNVTAEKYLEFAVNKIENEIGMRVKINEDVTFNAVYAPKSRILSDENIIAAIAAKLTYKVEAAVISVDKKRFAALKSASEAEEIKNTILDAYVQEGSEYIKKEFVEDFRIDMVFIEKSELTDADRAYRLLTDTADTETVYTVKSGDSLWQIAQSAGMSMNELYDLNPGVNSTIRAGQQITLMMQKPVLSVRTVEEIKYTEVLPKTVEYLSNSTQPRSYSRVIQQGRDGQQEVTAHVERINGFPVETRAVDFLITVPAVNDVIEIGLR